MTTTRPRTVAMAGGITTVATRRLCERERQAFLLWKLLDSIDSSDDACREYDDVFITLVRQVQRQRFSIMSEDDYVTLYNKYYATGTQK